MPCSFQGERNILYGNNGAGVAVYSGNANVIRGNMIGTNETATEAMPNTEGISVSEGTATLIGSPVSGHGNVISGNSGPGVLIVGGQVNPAGTVIAGNLIGVGPNLQPIGNGSAGVQIVAGSGITIGGTASAAERNVIASNGAPGVVILGGENNPILGNSIFGNLRLGIDLGGDGPTANDPRDVDQGPNRLQNSPQLEVAVTVPGAGVLVSGAVITEAPGLQVRVEFFRNEACGVTNQVAQARDLVHVFTGVSNADGVMAFQGVPVPGLTVGNGVPATATAALILDLGTARNTSEISNCTTVLPPR